jgi:hypothetical protein
MGNIIVSGAAVEKAGGNMPSIPTEATWMRWISGAEAYINSATRYNWSDNYAALNDDVAFVLNDTASSIVAMKAIAYDMSGFTSRAEAQTMLDILDDEVKRNIKILQDDKVKTFVKGA